MSVGAKNIETVMIISQMDIDRDVQNVLRSVFTQLF
jgi:hypothetical protein